MKKFKFFACLLIVSALLLPYTAFAEHDETEYGYGEGVVKDAFKTSDDAFSLSSVNDSDEQINLTDTDKEMLKYIVSEIQGFETRIQLPEEYQMPVDRFIDIYQQYMGVLIQYEHPEIFYLGNSFSYSYNIKTEYVTEIKLKYSPEYSLDNGDANIEAIEAAQGIIDAEIKNIISGTAGMTDIQKALYVHDYIAANYTYDTRVSDSDPDSDGNRTLDKMVEEKTGVCQGYSYLYMTVMNKLGIECVLVPTDELQHIWNKVKLDGEWYNVDVTYDDPVNSRVKRISHNYFLVNDNDLKELDPSDVENKLYLVEDGILYEFSEPHIYEGSDVNHFKITDGNDVIIENGQVITDEYGRTFITDGQTMVMYERKEQSCHIIWNSEKWDGSAIEASQSTRYSQSPIHYVTGPTAYANGKVFCTCSDSYPYYASNDIYEIIFEDATEVLRVRQQELSSSRWYIYGRNDSYYVNPLDPEGHIPYYSSGMATYNGKVYVNSPNTVYEFNTDTYQLTKVYEYFDIPDVSDTYLYGLRVKDNTLYAEYNTSYLDDVTLIPIPITAPEPNPEVFPEFAKPLPVEKPVVHSETKDVITDDATGETITNYEVTLSVDIPEEVHEAANEAAKPVTVSVAKYNEFGGFIGFEIVEVDENNQAKFKADSTCDLIKTFIWAGFIMPLSESTEYQFNQVTE